jgi:hypothetical protein
MRLIALHEFANGTQRRKHPAFGAKRKRMTRVPLRIANDSNRPFGDDSMSLMTPIPQKSARLSARELNHLAPSLDFRGHMGTELLGGEHQRNGRQFRKPSFDIQVC